MQHVSLTKAPAARLLAWTMLAMPQLHTPAHADTLARYVETQLTRQHLPGLALMVLKDGKGSGYGMGWFVDTMRGRPCWNTAAARPASRPRCCACRTPG